MVEEIQHHWWHQWYEGWSREPRTPYLAPKTQYPLGSGVEEPTRRTSTPKGKSRMVQGDTRYNTNAWPASQNSTRTLKHVPNLFRTWHYRSQNTRLWEQEEDMAMDWGEIGTDPGHNSRPNSGRMADMSTMHHTPTKTEPCHVMVAGYIDNVPDEYHTDHNTTGLHRDTQKITMETSNKYQEVERVRSCSTYLGLRPHVMTLPTLLYAYRSPHFPSQPLLCLNVWCTKGRVIHRRQSGSTHQLKLM